jgi:hypothetical protein
MRRLLPFVVLIAVAAPAAASTSYEIRTTGPKVSRIGPFRPIKDASREAAIAAFGKPSTTTARTLRWTNFGLKIRFSAAGEARSFQTRSRRFKTWAGLRPGDVESRIEQFHPAAERHGRQWYLQIGPRDNSDGRFLPVLKAIVRDGRVDRLDGWIGG